MTTLTKLCRKCGGVFPATLDYFYKCKSGRYGITGRCKSCICQQTREWVKNNPEQKKQQDKEYAANNAERKAETKRRWVKNNPDKKLQASRDYRKRNPGKNTPVATIWRLLNPDSTKAIKHRRRAKEHGLPNVFTDENWRNALEHFGGCCAVCGRPAGLWHKIAADHWIPLTADNCPGTVPTNIVPLCHGLGGCNNSKSNKDPMEWLQSRFGTRQAQLIIERIEHYFKQVKEGHYHERNP